MRTRPLSRFSCGRPRPRPLTALALGLAACLLLSAQPSSQPVAAGTPPPGGAAWLRVIVLVRAGADARRRAEPAMEALPLDADGETRNAWRGRRDRLLSQAAERAHGPTRDRVAASVEAAGGRVTHRFRLVPGLAAILPAGAVERLRRHPDVVSVHEDRVRRPLLNTLPTTLGLSAFTTAGVTGGSVDVAVMDTGVADERGPVYQGHPAFEPLSLANPARLRTVITVAAAAAGCPGENCGVSPFEDPTSGLDFHGHGTAVAGVVASQGFGDAPEMRGVVFGLRKLVNVKAALRTGLFDDDSQQQTDLGGFGLFDSDILDGMEAALSLDGGDSPEIFNLSFGAVAFRDFDEQDPYDREVVAQFIDAVVTERGKVVVVAAGNGGCPSDPTERIEICPQTVESPAIGYNVLAVGASDTRGTAARSDDVIWSGSARGPAKGPLSATVLRKKPDLVAPGFGIRTTDYLGGLTDGGAGEEAVGTSLAAPAVAGLAALLFDLPDLGDGTVTEATKSLAVRALLINSAEDRNQFHPLQTTPDGWDAAWGWGYVDGAKAYEQRRNILQRFGGVGSTYWVRRTASPTKATLVWDRQVTSDPVVAYPLTNLDLYLYGLADGLRRTQSTSTVDNVEQVRWDTAEPVFLRIDQTTSGGTAFAALLAHNGGFEAALPAVLGVTTTPVRTGPGAIVRVSGDLTGGPTSPRLPLHEVHVLLAPPQGYTFPPGEVVQKTLGTVDSFPRTVHWLVQAPSTAAPPRSFTLFADGRTVVDDTFDVRQNASAASTIEVSGECVYGPLPATVNLPAGGGAAAVALSASLPADCAWTVTGVPEWLDVSLTNSTVAYDTFAGLGPAAFRLAVNPYAGSAPRSATVVFGNVPVAVTQQPASRSYYLSEGATGFIFDLDIAIANPNDVAVPVEVKFLRPGGGLEPVTQSFTLAAYEQRVVSVDAIAGLESTDVSTVVTSPTGAPLVVERTMFWDGTSYGGHGGTAVDGPRTRWYFAEGSQGFFDTFVLLANANAQPANVTVTFLREGGAPPLVTTTTLAANSRDNVWTRLVPDLANTSFAIVVDSDVPITAERAMYFPGDPGQFPGKRLFEGGHESAGVGEPSTSWFHAEGATGDLFDEYILVGNPGAADAQVTFTFLLDSGQTVVARAPVQAERRFTLNVELLDYFVSIGQLTLVSGDPTLLRSAAVSTTVSSDVPVISERAMYWGGAFPNWYEAHNSFGVTATAARWGLAEGRVGGQRNFFTYILVANPNATDVQVRVTLLRQDGRATVSRTFTVPATSRFNVFANDDGWAAAGLQTGEGFGAIVESLDPSKPIAVERAMYWFGADPLFWTGGTNATAVPLP